MLYDRAKGNGGSLSDLFKPLTKQDLTNPGYERDKAYGPHQYSWLRLYAIRINRNVFVITGGAIKLTKTMEPPHLQYELKKLDFMKKYLDQGDNDETSRFYELSL